MSRFAFSLAGPEDDAQLRERMAADRMEGAIAVSFRREPSYFAGSSVQGDAVQVVKCTDTASGRIAGLGARATGMAYLGGEPRRIGYLADLRCAPEYRRGTLVARGYRYFRELHERDPVPCYTTVIYDGNEQARATLVGARAGLPVYRDAGRLRTPAIHLDRRLPPLAAAGVTLAPGSEARLPDIARFLDREFRRRPFAPVVRPGDFGSGRFRGLRGADFVLAERAGRLVGAVALWDQAPFRQTHVERYTPALRLLRPFYNLAARVTPLRPLPATGARVPYVYLALFAVEEDDPALARALLRAAYRRAREGPWHHAIAGVHERHPLAGLLDEYRRIEAAGRIYVVHYPGAAAEVDALAGAAPPHLEAGCL